MLSVQFKGVFTFPLSRMQSPADSSDYVMQEKKMAVITYIYIDEKAFIAAICEMSSNSANSLDSFLATLEKSCKQVLAGPLQTLFQSFLASGILSKMLKEDIICPIYKGGSRAEAINHKPISLASHISKVME